MCCAALAEHCAVLFFSEHSAVLLLAEHCAVLLLQLNEWPCKFCPLTLVIVNIGQAVSSGNEEGPAVS